jgi:hypothetical protein
MTAMYVQMKPVTNAKTNVSSCAAVESKLQEARQNEVRPILEKLSALHLSIADHPELREMTQLMQLYVKEGKKQTLHIPFPAHNCDIDGVLQLSRTWVRFTAKKK